MSAIALLAMAPVAHAAFPGLNGQIAYYTQQGTSDDIWLMQPDGSGNAPITGDELHERDPAWSPDGAKIAFVGAGSNNDIYVMNADGSGTVNLTGDFTGADDAPAWSPDGTKIAFVSNRVNDVGPKIYVMDADGSDVTRLTDGFGISDSNPAWAPDGRFIAFFRANQGQIFRMKSDGTEVTQVTTGSGTQDDPNWSPSGHRIAYSRSGGSPATTGIHTMDPDGSNDVDLSSALTEAHDPAWSPDGSKIVASRNGHVWTMNANGSSPTQLTTVFGTNGTPDWQPLPFPGYPRPRSASPLRASLVPAYQPCSSPNRTHGPPLAFGSCHPPAQVSGHLTVGTPDANGAGANSVGFLKMRVAPGAPGPPSDTQVWIDYSISDVRCAGATTTCGNANTAGGADYAGELEGRFTFRGTDKYNGPDKNEPATMTDYTFRWTASCNQTADPSIGSQCSMNNLSMDAVVPGIVLSLEGKRAIWEIEQVRFYDGGADGDADTAADNSLFATQGVFIP